MKPLVWVGSSLEDLRAFPEEVKDVMGYGLYLAQIGEKHELSDMNDTVFTESSGNVFADLGVENAEEALTKAKLARAISVIITRSHLTQTQAAAVLGVDQPKVSSLMRGRLAGFSIDRLLRFLVALDRDVEILIKAKPPTRTRGRLDVVAVSVARDTVKASTPA